MKSRLILYADDKKILTNGEVYGRQIFLAEGENPNDYYEITQNEYMSVSEDTGNDGNL